MPPLPNGLFAVPAGRLATVVTFLETTARPDEAPPSPPDGVGVRLVQGAQIDWYRTLYRRIGADWLWFSRLAMDDAALAATLHDGRSRVLALARDGVDIGLVEIDLRVEGAAEIVYFGLAPEATGAGLGRLMMAHALAYAWAPGVRRVWLHTCHLDHPRALPFYRRCGFTPYAQKVEVTDDPRAVGLLPHDAAPHIPMF